MRKLEAAIAEFITLHNQNPKPFVWTKTADQILAPGAIMWSMVGGSLLGVADAVAPDQPGVPGKGNGCEFCDSPRATEGHREFPPADLRGFG